MHSLYTLRNTTKRLYGLMCGSLKVVSYSFGTCVIFFKPKLVLSSVVFSLHCWVANYWALIKLLENRWHVFMCFCSTIHRAHCRLYVALYSIFENVCVFSLCQKSKTDSYSQAPPRAPGLGRFSSFHLGTKYETQLLQNSIHSWNCNHSFPTQLNIAHPWYNSYMWHGLTLFSVQWNSTHGNHPCVDT